MVSHNRDKHTAFIHKTLKVVYKHNSVSITHTHTLALRRNVMAYKGDLGEVGGWGGGRI